MRRWLAIAVGALMACLAALLVLTPRAESPRGLTWLELTDAESGRGIFATALSDGEEITLTWKNSLFNLTGDLGKGFGPVIISLLIVGFGRQLAFNIANLFWLLCGVFLLAMIITFPKDEARLNALLRERSRAMVK